MSYLVLARKKRPQVFEDVIGQRPITQTLQNAISQERVAHAFLFAGPRGVGKTSTARILAKALNCEKGPQINPCNQCAVCREISASNSLDVIEIDGASNRGIDEIRELRENVRYTPAKSRYKIFIIDEVHMLTREAFNALLKTLEEPPPHIIFVFATTEPHKMPATILSRCQRYDFKRIPLKEIIGSLKRIIEEEGVQISQRGLLYVAQGSEGSMRDAQSLLDQVISYGGKEIRDEDIAEVLGLIDRKILSDAIEAIASRDASRCMEIVEHVYHYGYDLQYFCRELLQYLRNLILMKVSEHPEGLMELPEEDLEVLKKQAEKFQLDQLNHLFSLLIRGEEEVTQSTFPRTMLEMTLIRMTTLHPILPVDEILKKLEGLEKTRFPIEVKESRRIFPSEKAVNLSSSEKGKDDEYQKSRKEVRQEREAEEEGPSTEVHGDERCSSSEEPVDTEGSGGDQGRETEDSPNACEGAWKGLVDFTRARNPVLGSFLALGNLVHLSDEKVELGFEKDSFHYERISERENRSQLEAICQEYLQRKVKVIISPLNQAMESRGRMTVDAEERVRPAPEKRSERGVEAHPLIREALRLFDGKIVEG